MAKIRQSPSRPLGGRGEQERNLGKMTPLQGIGLAVAAYLALLARSAWKQGEIRQFMMSCLVLILLFGIIVSVIGGYVWWHGR